MAHIATTRRTCFLVNPCLMTNAFCAPMAMINDSPVKSPGINAITTRVYGHAAIQRPTQPCTYSCTLCLEKKLL